MSNPSLLSTPKFVRLKFSINVSRLDVFFCRTVCLLNSSLSCCQTLLIFLFNRVRVFERRKKNVEACTELRWWRSPIQKLWYYVINLIFFKTKMIMNMWTLWSIAVIHCFLFYFIFFIFFLFENMIILSRNTYNSFY